MAMVKWKATAFVLIGLTSVALAQERINHAGRILGPAPTVTTAALFNTPAADAIVSAMQIMPRNNPWNEDISGRPLLANSAAMITQIRADLADNRKKLRGFFEMNYVLVPNNQANVAINFFNYPDESDPSPYPIPSNMPVETWPRMTGALTNAQWQEDINNSGGDRHSIIVQPGTGTIWETWLTKRVGANWQASNGAKFDITSNTLRTAGWTSADAAGLPMFPAIVRYDECQRGEIEHALRIIVKRTRREYIYPATHYASSTPATEVNVPAMGQRLRLKSTFSVPANWTKQEKAVCAALKKYGGIVADNGGFLSFSICPDNRYPNECFDNVSTIDVNDFEVIQTTDATGGPRSAGAPTANAGADQSIALGQNANLNGQVTGSGLTVTWYAYPGVTQPGTVTFGNASSAATTASFTQHGVYTLMLKADDGVHTPAYDAVMITVTDTGNRAPVIDSGASATPATITTSQNTSLAVLAHDPDGDNLTYTWDRNSGPAEPTFSINNSQASRTTTASFTVAGTYDLRVTVTDGSLSQSSNVTVTVTNGAGGTTSGGGGCSTGDAMQLPILLLAAAVVAAKAGELSMRSIMRS